MITSSQPSSDQSCKRSFIPDSSLKTYTSDKNKITPLSEDLIIQSKISKAKFPVYLVQSSSSGAHFAMKVFPYLNGGPNPRFLNEIRFSRLSHSNIVSTVDHQEEEGTFGKDQMTQVSYILMEYAPYGDFFDFVMSLENEMEEKLIRTYFHQLIEGLEYLHTSGIAHLDLKLENLLIGKNFTLKIADFDLAHLLRDNKVKTKGTKHYRAPELMNQNCEDPQAADIYSAGIILFVMKCGGVLPHLEDQLYRGINLSELLYENPEEFWEKHCKIQKKSQSFFEKSFRSLFISMTRPDVIERATIFEVKNSKWYNGPVYSEEELSLIMSELWDFRN